MLLKVVNTDESNCTVIEMIDLDLCLLNERLFTNEFVCRHFQIASENNTSQIFKRMVGFVEMDSHHYHCYLSTL